MLKGSRSRTHSVQQKGDADVRAATTTPTIILASDIMYNDDRRRSGGRILRHVRSTIVASSQSKAHLSAANMPSTLQSCSSPPLSRMSSRAGTTADRGGGCCVKDAPGATSAAVSRKEVPSRLRTISASATPLSAIRARSSIFTPKRWSNFLRPSQADLLATPVKATNSPQKKGSSPAPSPGPSISLPFNVCAAEGSALMNAVNQTKARSLYQTNSNIELGKCIYSDTLRRPKANIGQDAVHTKEHRTGIDKAGIRSWLLETNNSTSAQDQTEEDSTVKLSSSVTDNAEQSVYVIAPEHSIHSDDLSFSTCPTPILDSSPNTQTTGSTPDLRENYLSGAGDDTSSPISPAAHFASLSRASTTYDVSAWGSHPEGLCIDDDELSQKLRSLLRQPDEHEKQSRLRMKAMEGTQIGQPQQATGHSRLRNKISVADFLGMAKQTSGPAAACNRNASPTDSLIDRPISVVSESICGHEEDVVIRTAWRANFSHLTASQAQEQRKGRPGRSGGKRLTLLPCTTSYGKETEVWEDCKTPRQPSLGKSRNSSCPPSPTTTTTIGSADGDLGTSARITPVRSMTIPNSSTMSTMCFEDERESFDLCEHLLVRAQQHRRYAIHE